MCTDMCACVVFVRAFYIVCQDYKLEEDPYNQLKLLVDCYKQIGWYVLTYISMNTHVYSHTIFPQTKAFYSILQYRVFCISSRRPVSQSCAVTSW